VAGAFVAMPVPVGEADDSTGRTTGSAGAAGGAKRGEAIFDDMGGIPTA